MPRFELRHVIDESVLGLVLETDRGPLYINPRDVAVASYRDWGRMMRERYEALPPTTEELLARGEEFELIQFQECARRGLM